MGRKLGCCWFGPELPTAQQSDADAQVTPLSWLNACPLATAGTRVHDDPFQCSIKVPTGGLMPAWVEPAAQQSDVVGHDKLLRKPFTPGAVGTTDQEDPFQCSAVGEISPGV